MSDLVLVLGNRNYSSWSLRAWLALKQSGLPFREELIWFGEDVDRRQRLKYSPTGRVPVLLHGDLAVWDSLAIGEYLAELAPDAGLWPSESMPRARARSLCAEMHAGFAALRQALPLNVRGRTTGRDPGPEVRGQIERIASMWAQTRRDFGAAGPYLFGALTLADAFYAPVASRFQTYGVELQGEAARWAEAILDLPAMRAWAELAASEGHVIPAYDSLL